MPNPTAEKIMDAAELRVRAEGYNAVSFRDLANDTGIKSASVHYHFPTKEDLGVALVERYCDRIQNALAEEGDGLDDPKQKISLFVDQYRKALKVDHSICLCAMLGAESIGLPPAVSERVDQFFETGTNWLEAVFQEAGHPAPAAAACHTLSSLSGAMIVASTSKDPDIFEKTAYFIENLI